MRIIFRIKNLKFRIMLILCVIALFIIHTALFSSPTYAQSPTPQDNPEEQAIYIYEKSVLPSGVTEQKGQNKNNNPLEDLINKVKSLTDSLGQLFFTEPGDKTHTFYGSESSQKATLPTEFKPKPEVDIPDQIKTFLGGVTGRYGKNLPQFNQDGIGQTEKSYEKSYYPEEVHPITGK